MQLVAMGAQDVYLTGNPQITFFKVVYRRHTNFSKEAIKQEWNGTGSSRTCTLARNGDLVQEMYILGNGANVLNQAHITSVEVEIGGQKIDKHYGTWLVFMMNYLTKIKSLKTGFNKNFLPLRFWFNRNPGLALPLIALQYHEVKDCLELNSNANTSHWNTGLLVNYLYLDTDERRRFAQVSHEYLIEQVQHTGTESVCNASAEVTASGTDNITPPTASKSITLTFNHPVKALFWNGLVTQDGDGEVEVAKQVGLASYTAKLQLNGHDRASEQGHLYYTGVQPYENGLRQCYTAPNLTTGSAGMYSFCLKPGEHQPSGTCNFSRIDNARLVLNLTGPSTVKNGQKGQLNAQSINIFALNYNVLRIMSGMGGLAYSN